MASFIRVYVRFLSPREKLIDSRLVAKLQIVNHTTQEASFVSIFLASQVNYTPASNAVDCLSGAVVADVNMFLRQFTASFLTSATLPSYRLVTWSKVQHLETNLYHVSIF